MDAVLVSSCSSPRNDSTGMLGSRPYMANNGEYPVEACGVVLYAKVSSGKCFGQRRLLSSESVRNKLCIVLLKRSHWPLP